MTNSNNDNLEIRALLAELTRRQIQTQEQIQATQEQIETTQEQLRELTSDTNRVLARSAILDDVVLELRENQ